MNETLFYVFGIALAISAVVFSFIGLKVSNFPGRAFPLVILWFLVLAGGATTYSVLHAQDEQHHKEAEFEKAGKEIEKDETSGPFEEEGGEEAGGAEEGGEEGEPEAGAGGAGGTLQLAADPSAIAYDTDSLESAAGEVTIDFTNPAPIEHDVAIEKDGKEIAATETITEGEAEVKTDLEPGEYTFLCTVPGHAEAGMEGTLVVK